MIIQEANRRAMDNGDLTFGHGVGPSAAAIWARQRICKANMEFSGAQRSGASDATHG